eukprot:gene19417-26074_t
MVYQHAREPASSADAAEPKKEATWEDVRAQSIYVATVVEGMDAVSRSHDDSDQVVFNKTPEGKTPSLAGEAVQAALSEAVQDEDEDDGVKTPRLELSSLDSSWVMMEEEAVEEVISVVMEEGQYGNDSFEEDAKAGAINPAL